MIFDGVRYVFVFHSTLSALRWGAACPLLKRRDRLWEDEASKSDRSWNLDSSLCSVTLGRLFDFAVLTLIHEQHNLDTVLEHGVSLTV